MQEALFNLIWVVLGSAFGGIARFFLSGFVGRRIGETFPWGTLAVNVTGALTIGAMADAANARLLFNVPEAWALAVTGFLGAYTTVSSFSLQTLALAREGDWLRAGGNVVLSVVSCVTAAALGFALAARLFAGAAL